MENQYGFLTRADGRQNQQTFADPDLRIFLNQQHVTNEHRLKNDLLGFFLSAWSFRRSYIFMNFRFRKPEYTTYMGKDIKEFVPVYGVKGGAGGLARDTKYVSLHMSDEKDIMGAGFNEYIFGTKYITEDEACHESNQDALLQREKRSVSYEIAPAHRQLAARIMEKLWEAQERDPATRFIILLDDAENSSMDLLQEIYLLIPQRLRLQLGFETNVVKADLDTVSQYGLPIYVLTMERSEYGELEGYNFPIAVFDVNAQEQYTYNPDRLRTLEQIVDNMHRTMTVCMGYAEKIVMKEKRSKGSDFCFYQEILERMNTPELYWWDKKRYTDIEQLYLDYLDQEELMADDLLKKEAVSSFYLKILPQSDYASRIVDIVKNREYPDRQKYLDFLEDRLYYGKEIKAVEDLVEAMEKEKAAALLLSEKAAKEREQQKEKEVQERERQKEIETKEREKQKAAEAKEHERQQLEAQKKQLKQKFESEKQASLAALSKKCEENQRKVEAELESKRKQCKDAEKRIKNLEKENESLNQRLAKREESEPEKEIKRLDRALERQKEQTKRTRIILLSTTIIMTIIAVVGIIAAVLMMKSANSAQEELRKTESERNTAQTDLDEIKKELGIKESENAELQSKLAESESQAAGESKEDIPVIGDGTGTETGGQQEPDNGAGANPQSESNKPDEKTVGGDQPSADDAGKTSAGNGTTVAEDGSIQVDGVVKKIR